VTTERFVVIGLSKVRARWFADVAQWCATSQVPVEFQKCVGIAEARARLTAGRPVSAFLVDGGAPGLDRDVIDTAAEHGVAVIVVEDARLDRDWIALGAVALLPETFDAATLMAALNSHAEPVRSVRDGAWVSTEIDESTSDWRGLMVAVTGGSGTGSSTIAMSLAQGLAAIPGHEGSVALADFAGCGDLAMYHDVRDVMPGLLELVEAHRTTNPGRSAVRKLLFDIDRRGYSLLLGLRRSRDWTALRPRAVDAALASLLDGFRVVVADVRPELDGEEETGSVDTEERNHVSRATMATADAIVVCGDASLKGVHSLVRAERTLLAAGVTSDRIVRVVNRSPRSPRQRAEIGRALADLGVGEGSLLGVVHLPERRLLDVTHSVGQPLPSSLVQPVTRAVIEVLRSFDDALVA